MLIAAASAYAVQRSVTVELRWKVLPYQTLRLVGSGDDVTSVRYAVPAPSALDVARGYIEDENAVRLQVVSNTPWKLQVRLEGTAAEDAVLIRGDGGSYEPLSDAPRLLARGEHGSFDLGVDYRVLLDENGSARIDDPLDLVYTIMSD